MRQIDKGEMQGRKELERLIENLEICGVYVCSLTQKGLIENRQSIATKLKHLSR